MNGGIPSVNGPLCRDPAVNGIHKKKEAVIGSASFLKRNSFNKYLEVDGQFGE
jgi:hypothetical protein